jgi:conjugative transposon TraN protein
MKYQFLMIVILSLSWLDTFAQSVQVSWDKTTVLIFDSPIKSVDRGSQFLLSELDAKAANVLKLKAGSRELPETNLHVLTEDGGIHAFQVHYAENPLLTTLDLRAKSGTKQAIYSYDFSPAEFELLAEYLSKSSAKLIKKQFRYEMHFWLQGIYIQDGLLFFDLAAKNNSAIPFEVLGPEVKVVDTKSKKQSSARDEKLKPYLDRNGEQQVLSRGEEISLLMAFPAFTISNRKRLLFYLKEKHGDRELQLALKGRKILQAIPLPYVSH